VAAYKLADFSFTADVRTCKYQQLPDLFLSRLPNYWQILYQIAYRESTSIRISQKLPNRINVSDYEQLPPSQQDIVDILKKPLSKALLIHFFNYHKKCNQGCRQRAQHSYRLRLHHLLASKYDMADITGHSSLRCADTTGARLRAACICRDYQGLPSTCHGRLR